MHTKLTIPERLKDLRDSEKECRCRNYLMLPAFPFQRLANETYINGLLLLFCKNLEMKVTQLSVEEK